MEAVREGSPHDWSDRPPRALASHFGGLAFFGEVHVFLLSFFRAVLLGMLHLGVVLLHPPPACFLLPLSSLESEVWSSGLVLAASSCGLGYFTWICGLLPISFCSFFSQVLVFLVDNGPKSNNNPQDDGNQTRFRDNVMTVEQLRSHRMDY